MYMENQYQKTFPELMAGKKIMYCHGFGSAGSTHTATLLREYMPQATVVAPDIPLHPEEGLKLLKDVADSEQPDLIIGTSMGGMYAEMLHGRDRILVNPAFNMADTMNAHGLTGKQTWHNPRADGEQTFLVTKGIVHEYREIAANNFTQTEGEEQQHVWGLFGDEDDVVHTFDLFKSHYRQAIHFHGGHRLMDKALLHYVMPVIRWIDDRQEGRERKTIFIHWNTMADAYGKPTSSLHKAYELLLDHYNVFFVAPSPNEDEAFIPHVQAWIKDVCSTPAWNHIIFTSHPELLYGDYMICNDEMDDFMGTTLQYGSDEFKTWEEIIVYFERLGGQ